MKNFIVTAIAVCTLAAALIINTIKLNDRITELENALQQTYIELQEHKYKNSDSYTNDHNEDDIMIEHENY